MAEGLPIEPWEEIRGTLHRIHSGLGVLTLDVIFRFEFPLSSSEARTISGFVRPEDAGLPIRLLRTDIPGKEMVVEVCRRSNHPGSRILRGK
jgi:hypothetical protein